MAKESDHKEAKPKASQQGKEKPNEKEAFKEILSLDKELLPAKKESGKLAKKEKSFSYEKNAPYTESNIQWYLEEINKIPLLSREEEDELARRAAKGDKEAKNKLIVSNLRFVVQIAKKYQQFGIPLLDLINEGNMGLIKAAERFNPDKGYHFISYAVWWIRQAIILAINQKGSMIRIPVNRTIDLNKIEKVQKELQHKLGREPTLPEIAENLDISEKEIKWLQQLPMDTVSLDAPLGKDGNNTHMQIVEDIKSPSPENEYFKEELKQALEEILNELTENERKIIELRYGLNGQKPLSLTAAGEMFGLSKERVRQIEKKTLLKLQRYGEKKKLKEFLSE
ncbi:MAG: RNA polymerase sigma factor RpoD/SigA [Candidatus Hydrogenedentota bacterium]|nr:MAG: RNA polymerase sigma factor RpoD/SigA [Candidatus Hydrogenedentota bacterium]